MNSMHRRRYAGASGSTTKASTGSRKVIIEFPEDLLKEAERAASELSTDRSKLIRSAVEAFLERREKLRLEEELAEGYRTFATLDREIAAEFAYVDSENL